MRLPGFTAEQGISRAGGGSAAVSAFERFDGSDWVVPAYMCSDKACVCTGVWDCLSCISDPTGCGNKGSYICQNGTCLFSRYANPTGGGAGTGKGVLGPLRGPLPIF
jgi:hypothetical protein